MAVNPYPTGETVSVTADYVFRAVEAIRAAGKQAEFLDLCTEKNVRVTVDAEAANLVRGFIDEHVASSSLDGMVARSIEGDRCSCP